jgi:hypothetical protein
LNDGKVGVYNSSKNYALLKKMRISQLLNLKETLGWIEASSEGGNSVIIFKLWEREWS